MGIEQGEQLFLDLGQREVLDGGRGRVGVSSASQGRAYPSHVHIRSAAPGHHVNPIHHESHGEEHPDALHVQQLVGEQREIVDVAVQAHFGHDHAYSVDLVGGGGFQQIVEQGHLFGIEFVAEQLPDDHQIHALALEPAPDSEVFLRCGGKGEGARVLEQPQPQDGGLVGLQRDAAGHELPGENRGGGAGGANQPPGVGEVVLGIGGVGVVVVGVYFQPWTVQQMVDMGEPGTLAGIHHHQGFHAGRVHVRGVAEIEHIGGALNKKVSQVAFLAAGKNQDSSGIQLARRDDGGQGVEIRVVVGGDDGGGVYHAPPPRRAFGPEPRDRGWNSWWMRMSRSVCTWV